LGAFGPTYEAVTGRLQAEPLRPNDEFFAPPPATLAYRARMDLLITWAMYTVALAVVAAIVPGFEIKGGLKGHIIVAALFGLLNWALGWLLSAVLTVATLGLFWLLGIIAHTIVLAIVLLITDRFTDRLNIRSFWIAWLAAALISVSVGLLERVL
jgi:putative membrane protein